MRQVGLSAVVGSKVEQAGRRRRLLYFPYGVGLAASS